MTFFGMAKNISVGILDPQKVGNFGNLERLLGELEGHLAVVNL